MNLGERIKNLRQRLEWTQDKLAQETGLSKSFLSEVEHDKASISGENLLKIANALNTSLDYLMKGESRAGEKKQMPVEIPPELSEVAEELGLSYRNTIDILTAYNSILARRSSKEKKAMTKQGWRDLYEVLKKHLEQN